ncbi:11072_t:CDS:2, partial [Scutellospora calospora]
MEDFTHPLLNSIFSETHQELQTLQNDFSYLQTHFVNINNNKDNLNNNTDENLETNINNNEEDFIKKMSETICCQYNCLKEKINTQKAYLRYFSFQNLSKNNQDSFLMGYFIGISKSQETSKGNKRVRIYYDYSFDSDKICLQAFKFIYGIGSTRIENIRIHLSKEDIKTRIHKSAKKSSHTAIPFLTIIKIITTESYASLYRQYLNAIQQYENIEELFISLSSFKRILKNYLSEIKFLTPRSNLCFFCKIMRFNTDKWTIKEKELKVIEWSKHIETANNEREYYKQCIKQAKINILNFDKKTLIRPGKINSLDIELHLSWDFAQQVHLPSSSQQEGEIFFKSLYKIHVFGICDDAFPRQVTLAMDSNECNALLFGKCNTIEVCVVSDLLVQPSNLSRPQSLLTIPFQPNNSLPSFLTSSYQFQ